MIKPVAGIPTKLHLCAGTSDPCMELLAGHYRARIALIDQLIDQLAGKIAGLRGNRAGSPSGVSRRLQLVVRGPGLRLASADVMPIDSPTRH